MRLRHARVFTPARISTSPGPAPAAHTVDVHRARAADALAARAAESESRVELSLDLRGSAGTPTGRTDLEDGVEHHGARLGEVDRVRLEMGLLGGSVGILLKYQHRYLAHGAH